MVRWHALMGARMLSRNGERAAAIDFLERTYRLSEDEELRQQIVLQLRALHAEDAAERAKESVSRFEETWRGELPFVSRTMILLLGPRTDPWPCAGVAHPDDPRCVRDWGAWTARETAAANSFSQ